MAGQKVKVGKKTPPHFAAAKLAKQERTAKRLQANVKAAKKPQIHRRTGHK